MIILKHFKKNKGIHLEMWLPYSENMKNALKRILCSGKDSPGSEAAGDETLTQSQNCIS